MSHDTEATSSKRKLRKYGWPGGLASCIPQGFQNFSNVPVLHYLQAVLFLKN
jgi:hypothetical protein